MRLDLETDVRYPTGERVGTIRRVVLDESNQVMAIVMATDEFMSRDLVVPLAMLEEAPGGVINLIGSPDQLDNLESYEEGRIPAVTEEWQIDPGPAMGGDVFPETMYDPIIPVMELENLREGLVGLSQGTEIWCLDGRWGVIDEVLVNDEGHAYSFIGRPDAKDEYDRIIPTELIQETASDRTVLNCTLADLETYTQETRTEYEEPERE